MGISGKVADVRCDRRRRAVEAVRVVAHKAGACGVACQGAGLGGGGAPRRGRRGGPGGSPMWSTPARGNGGGGGGGTHLARRGVPLDVGEKLPPSPSDPQLGMDLRKTALLRSMLLRTEVRGIAWHAPVTDLVWTHSTPLR